MIPHYSNLRVVTAADLKGLVDGQAEERIQLEFKQDAYDRNLDEWPKDISAFANMNGGVIAMGIREEGGIAKEIVGIPRSTVDAKICALTQKCCSAVRPVPSVGYWPIDVGASRTILLAGTAPSRFRPHACNHGTRFYKRMERNIQEMDRDDLARAFSSSMTQEESALLIHRPRVDNSLLSTSISAVVVLDVVPVPADQQRFDPNVEEQLTELGAHFSETRWSRGSNRIVFDGLLYSPDRGAEIWIQRSGALLAMWHLLPEGQNKTFPAVAFCNQLIGTIVNALGALRLMDAVCPAHLCLSLARSDGWSLRVPERWTMTEPKPILGERLEFPVLYWDGADPGSESVMRLIRDWLDRLWNASGFRSCNLYDVNTGVPDWKSFAQWGDGS